MPVPSADNNWKTRVGAYLPTNAAAAFGLVMVFLPGMALFAISTMLPLKSLEVGLPIIAIFGIMILFGSMALVAALFARQGLSAPGEALALPPGSVRSVIALSLIVLFAILAIMLFQSMAKPYIIAGIVTEDKDAIVKNGANRVLAVVVVDCPAKVKAMQQSAVQATLCYDVHLVQPPGQESFDLAKQLLVLIGTLMTSVTSYYFATQATAKATEMAMLLPGGGAKDPVTPTPPGDKPPDPDVDTLKGRAGAESDRDCHVDGCNVSVDTVTDDKDLPATKGGVAQ